MNTIALSGVPFMLATPVIAATIMAVLPGYRAGGGSEYRRSLSDVPRRSVPVHLEARADPLHSG